MLLHAYVYVKCTYTNKFLLLGRNEILGDVLCLIAALANAIIMVAQDHIIKTRTVVEYLGMIGIFGFILSSVQM